MPSGSKCAVLECKNRTNKRFLSDSRKISFHYFPKDIALRYKWKTFCRQQPEWNPTSKTCMCSVHFRPNDFEDCPSLLSRKKLKQNAVPSIYSILDQDTSKLDACTFENEPSTSKVLQSTNGNISHDTIAISKDILSSLENVGNESKIVSGVTYNEGWEPNESNIICTIHIPADDFERNSKRKKLKVGDFPTPLNEKCVLTTCGNTKSRHPEKTFYNFPKDPLIGRKWCSSIFGTEETNEIDDFFVCSDHFTSDSYELESRIGSRILKNDAIPTIKVPYIIYEVSPVVKKERLSPLEIRCHLEDGINKHLVENVSPEIIIVKYEAEDEENERTENNLNFDKFEQYTTESEDSKILKSLDTICRICFKEGNNTEITTVAWGGITLVGILNKYASIDINVHKKLPQKMCESCIKNMYDAYYFLTKCQSSENYLKQLLDNSEDNSEEYYEVKGEFDLNATLDSDSCSVNSEDVHPKPESDKTDNTQLELARSSRLQQKSNLINATQVLPWNVYKPPVRVRGPPFTCPVCNATYKTRQEFSKHRKEAKHLRSLKYVCPLNCGKRYKTLMKLREHYRSHTGEKWEKCHSCNFTTNYRTSLRRHEMIHDNIKPHKCDHCGLSFIRLETYKNHLRKYHNEDKLKCPSCPKEFYTQNAYNAHLRDHQEDTSDNQEDTSDCELEVLMNKSFKLAKGQHQCEICGKTLRSKRAFSAHVESHGPKQISCDQCDKMFASKMKLYQHKYCSHRSKKHICQYCGVTFRLLQKYKEHIIRHEENIVCKICDKKFLSKRSLTEHMHLHSDHAPIKCHICQKPLRTNGHLTIHLRTHTGEKPYVCDVCGKEFAQKWNMLAHKNTHDIGRCYQCDRCGTSFKDERSCRRHKTRNVCLPKFMNIRK